MDWYPFNPTDFRRDTYHLCAAADGIYRRLIDEYMLTGKPLPDHDSSLAGIARVSGDEWQEHRKTVRPLFQARDGKLFHKRCEKELHAQRMLAASRSKQAREAATVRWAKEKLSQRGKCGEHADSNAVAMLSDATIQDNIRILTTASVVEGQQAGKEAVASSELKNIVRKWS